MHEILITLFAWRLAGRRASLSLQSAGPDDAVKYMTRLLFSHTYVWRFITSCRPDGFISLALPPTSFSSPSNFFSQKSSKYVVQTENETDHIQEVNMGRKKQIHAKINYSSKEHQFQNNLENAIWTTFESYDEISSIESNDEITSECWNLVNN